MRIVATIKPMIRKTLFTLAITFLVAAAAETKAAPSTMRLDYYHTGNASQEMFSVDRVVIEPLPWPGNPQKNIDETNLGKYFFEVRDRATNRLLYSRGFASVFGEWVTTDEAASRAGTFSESVRFPWPRKPVQLVIKKRDKDGAFQQIWSTLIDPASRFVNPSDRKAAGRVWNLIENGPASEKVMPRAFDGAYLLSQSTYLAME